MPRLFILEDNAVLAKNLQRLLRGEGYESVVATSVAEAYRLLDANRYDLALLDISLPDGNGFAVCTEIKTRYRLPVIFLSASSEEASVVTGLNMGADDYITKPFRPRELMARILAALRKNGTNQTLSFGTLTVNTQTGLVKKGERELYLSALDYRLLLVFLHHPKTILTRDRLIDELWAAAGEYISNNTLTVYIKRLRERIEDDPATPRIIVTVRGIGYRLGDEA